VEAEETDLINGWISGLILSLKLNTAKEFLSERYKF